MSTTTDEATLRRRARKQGLELAKSPCRDPRAPEWGTYMLTDDHNMMVAGDINTGYGLSLDEIERELDA